MSTTNVWPSEESLPQDILFASNSLYSNCRILFQNVDSFGKQLANCQCDQGLVTRFTLETSVERSLQGRTATLYGMDKSDHQAVATVNSHRVLGMVAVMMLSGHTLTCRPQWDLAGSRRATGGVELCRSCYHPASLGSVPHLSGQARLTRTMTFPPSPLL